MYSMSHPVVSGASTNLAIHSLVAVLLVVTGIARGPLHDAGGGIGSQHRARTKDRCQYRTRAFLDTTLAVLASTLAFLSSGFLASHSHSHSHSNLSLAPSPSVQHCYSQGNAVSLFATNSASAGPSDAGSDSAINIGSWCIAALMWSLAAIIDMQSATALPANIIDATSFAVLVSNVAWLWAKCWKLELQADLHIFCFAAATGVRFLASLYCCIIPAQKFDFCRCFPKKPSVTSLNNSNRYFRLEDDVVEGDGPRSNPGVQRPISAEGRAIFWSRAFFCWIAPLLRLGYRRKRLDLTDLPSLRKGDDPSTVYQRFLKLWESSPKLMSVLHSLVFYRFYISGLLLAGSMIAGFAQPILLHLLLEHLEKEYSSSTQPEDRDLNLPLQLAAGLSVVSLLKSLLIHQFWIEGVRCSMHIEMALRSHMLNSSIKLDPEVLSSPASESIAGSQDNEEDHHPTDPVASSNIHGASYSDASRSYSTGKLLNLLSTDASKVSDTFVIPAFHWGTWFPAVTLGVSIYNLYNLLGKATYAGVAATVVFVGLGVWIGGQIKVAAARTVAKRDVRSTLLEQVLKAMSLVKSSMLEKACEADIQKARSQEMSHQRYQQILAMLAAAVAIIGPLLTTALTFALFSLSGGQLTAARAFASLAWFNTMRDALRGVPWAFTATMGSIVSIGRLERFFNYATSSRVGNDSSDRTHNISGCRRTQQIYAPRPNASEAIRVDNVSLGWLSKGGMQDTSTFVLANVSFTVNYGEFVCVTGPVGCGKSTILSALIGYLQPISGRILRHPEWMRGRISYVGQNAWLKSTTIRENITMFGVDAYQKCEAEMSHSGEQKVEVDKERLRKAVSCCMLEADIQEMPLGLDTPVGSDGVTLSGGQRQRIALARAVYSDREIIILDDVLSAVDALVRSNIVEKCLIEELKKKGKTVILVTHDLKVLNDACVDAIVHVGTDGSVAKEACTFSDASPAIANLDEDFHSVGAVKFDRSTDLGREVKLNEQNQLRLDSEDIEDSPDISENTSFNQINEGRISCTTVQIYLKSVGYISVGLVVVLFLVGGVFSVGQQWYLAVWVKTNSANSTSAPVSSSENVFIYSCISGSSAIIALIRVVILTLGSLRAAVSMHNRALHGIIFSPLSTFGSIKRGVLMNRMLGDVAKIDEVLANAIVGLVTMLVQVLSVLGVIALIVPLVLVLLPILAWPYWIAAQYYRWGMRDLRRIQSSSRAPLLTQFEECLSGLPVIHAFNAQNLAAEQFTHALRENGRAYFSAWAANQWVTCILESIGVLLIGGCAVGLTILGEGIKSKSEFSAQIPPGKVGMTLSLTFGLPGAMMWLVRNFTSMETELVAVERLADCINLEPEIEVSEIRQNFGNFGKLNTAAKSDPCADFPTLPILPRLCDRDIFSGAKGSGAPDVMPFTGRIEIRNLWMKYRDGRKSRVALRGLSVVIPAGSKVAVVGRTAAGKSSLFLALQKLHSFEGILTIDHIAGHQRGTMHLLREAISYVSQDPILFEGTVRSNLLIGLIEHSRNSSFDIPSDQDLWKALRKVSMDKKVSDWEGGLDAQISSGGSNISAGERQMLCFARSLLHRARVLLIDEGMSSVDASTDAELHKTLLGLEGCTVLSICHNLGSLQQFDFVAVMDAGKIVQFGSPSELLGHAGPLSELVGQ